MVSLLVAGLLQYRNSRRKGDASLTVKPTGDGGRGSGHGGGGATCRFQRVSSISKKNPGPSCSGA